MNKLEKFLVDHREQILAQDVNPEIWLNIENQLLRRKNRQSKLIIRWLTASAATGLLLWGVFSIGNISSNKLTATPEMILSQYDLQEENYPDLILAKTAKLADSKIPVQSQEDFNILINQLSFLDQQYHDYLKYIETHGYQKFIGNQLANYYEAKIELLDKIQAEIEKINYYENEENNGSFMVNLKL